MFRILRGLILFGALSAPSGAQSADGLENAIPLGPGVLAPHPTRTVEAEYTQEARLNHIQGNVVLMLAVEPSGRPTGITVISPLGYGLDEMARTAVAHWSFRPGRKDGRPAKVLSTVEVKFRFPRERFDDRTERQRGELNLALHDLSLQDPATVDRAVKTMLELSRQNFAPAMHVLANWQMGGEHVPRDPAAGLDLLLRAALRNYGQALYQVGTFRVAGRGLPKDPEQGLEDMRQAALLGAAQAQFSLGDLYERGLHVERDPDRARRYFRLCAGQGVAACQFRLGRLLLKSPNPAEHDLVQAVAWYQLAAERGFQEAKDALPRAAARLTAPEIAWVETLKTQLQRQPER